MSAWLLDTSIAVDHLRGSVAATQLLVDRTSQGHQLFASEVTRFELLAGVRDAETASLAEFFSVIDWVPLDEVIARVAGRVAKQFRRSHSGIDTADYLIAATALVLDARLLTANVRHFPMFADLVPPY